MPTRLERVYHGLMVFDEAAADSAVRELAAITDERQIAEIREALDAVIAAWRTWRADRAYPRPGDPFRGLMTALDGAVHEASVAVASLPARPAVDTMVNVVGPILGAYVPGNRRTAAFSAAVDRLRWLAMHRTTLIDDARRLTRPRPG